jgi:hypothetical protein
LGDGEIEECCFKRKKKEIGKKVEVIEGFGEVVKIMEK